jgi:hypothetical protein
MSTRMLALSLVLALTTAAPASRADRLVTSDGRVLEVESARLLEDGTYRLVFASGEIVCPAEYVVSIEIEGDMSDYVPKNDDERKKLEKGFVRYRDRWMSKAAYEVALKRDTDAKNERTADLAAHAAFDAGWEIKTKHFRLQSNTSPELLEHYGELLEAFYAQVDDDIGLKASKKTGRLSVNIYKSSEDFHSHNPEIGPGVAGFFVSGSLNFFHDYLDPKRSEWVALHECMHLLTYLINPSYRPQIWLNEGVADYYGSARVERASRKRIEIEPGQLQLDRVLTVQQAIRENKDLALSELFVVSDDDFNAFEYAHAWSFVYFLHQEDKYRKSFRRAFRNLYALKAQGIEHSNNWYSPADTREYLLRMLKAKEIQKLDQEWKDFIAAIEIDTPRARYLRGMRTLQEQREDDFELAQDDLNAAIEAGVDHPRAFAARGALTILRQGDFEGAEKDFRRAVELAPLVGEFRSYLGQVLAGYFAPGGLKANGDSDDWVPPVGGDRLREAGKQLGLAVELDRDNDILWESYEFFHEACERRAR